MKPLRLISRTVLTGLEQGLHKVVETWSHDWCCAPAPVSVACRAAQTFAAPDGGRMLTAKATDQSGTLWLTAAAGAWKEILFGELAGRCPQDVVFAELRVGATSALLRAIAGLLGMRDARFAYDAPAPEPLAGGPSSFVVAELVLADQPLILVLDAPLSARLPRAAPRTGARALVPRHQALLKRAARATVRLDLGEYPLVALESLRPGAVLTSSRSIAQPFELYIGAQLTLPVMLGRRNMRKAVTLIVP
jgi:hypothetical protein